MVNAGERTNRPLPARTAALRASTTAGKTESATLTSLPPSYTMHSQMRRRVFGPSRKQLMKPTLELRLARCLNRSNYHRQTLFSFFFWHLDVQC